MIDARLYSEDLKSAQTVESPTVINPFVSQDAAVIAPWFARE